MRFGFEVGKEISRLDIGQSHSQSGNVRSQGIERPTMIASQQICEGKGAILVK